MKEIEKLVRKLEKNKETIATMESCTGGALVNQITNISGASNVLKYSAVTYSNEYKIKMSVEKNVIDTYGVYSAETASNMAKQISDFAKSDYGVGITGKIDQEAYMCIYENERDTYHNLHVELQDTTREENKNIIIECVITKLNEILKFDN